MHVIYFYIFNGNQENRVDSARIFNNGNDDDDDEKEVYGWMNYFRW